MASPPQPSDSPFFCPSLVGLHKASKENQVPDASEADEADDVDEDEEEDDDDPLSSPTATGVASLKAMYSCET